MWQARGKMMEDVAGLEDDGRCGRPRGKIEDVACLEEDVTGHHTVC